MTVPPYDNIIDASLDRISRGDFAAFEGILAPVELSSMVGKTKLTSYCHHIDLGGNGLSRIEDLISFMSDRVINYAIPRKAINEAKAKDIKYNTTSNVARLRKQAEKLFTNIINSGEGGELLLYIFAEEFLKLPQILTKMDLKTNSQMHFHGADGVYLGIDQDTKNLCLYWGESKIYSDFQSATFACLESLACFLKGEFKDGKGNPVERELTLLQRNMHLDDPELEMAIKNHLDKESPLFNKVESRGIALVGFDDKSYPVKPNITKASEVHSAVAGQLTAWKTYIEKRAIAEAIDSYQFHFFILPIPSAEGFRKSFLDALGIAKS